MKQTKEATILSWLAIIMWTWLMCYLLLWPSKGTAVEDVSDFFGGTDLTDAMGHITLVFVETALMYNLLSHYYFLKQAHFIALASTLTFSILLELAQYWIPGRGFALLDLSANSLGVAIFAFVFREATLHGWFTASSN